MASSSSDWAQLYEQADFHGQAPVPSIGFSDATSVATSGSSDIINPTSSITSSAGDQMLTPKGCGSKPIRRRSRASKKAPTTLLNASSANFRALVQQFTGCSSPPNSFRSQKGPINLNFGLGSAQNRSYATAEMAPFDSIYYHGQPTEKAQQLPQDQGSLDHLPDRNAYFSMSSDLGPSLDRPADDGFFNMDDIALQELAKESFSDENMNNINCF